MLALAVAGAVAWAAPAAADATILAGPPSQYLTPSVTIDQGEKVTFLNMDLVEHDVLSRDFGSDGKPMFRSELVGGGGTSPVVGAEYLVTGSYAFLCSVHPSMTGTLTVTSAGTPAPRPGPGGDPRPGPSGGSDQQAPALRLAVADSKLAAVRRRGALKVRVRLDEDARVALTARVGKTKLARGRRRLAKGTRTVSLKLTKAGKRRIRRARRVRVVLSAFATDAAGNKRSARARRTLR